MSASGWRLVLRVPEAAAALFERALQSLGGAIVSDGRDGEGRIPLSAYLQEKPEQPRIMALLAAAAAAGRVPVPGFGIEMLPDIDWVAESERALPPVRAGRFFVHGAHVTERPSAGSIPILIEASVAFGTGRHESTFGCLLALQDLAKRRSFQRPLDMGCGSGLLAIAMAKLWPAPVLAADLDPDSVRMAAENARRNGVRAAVRAVHSDGYRGAAVAQAAPYDLVVANILAGPLAAMAPGLRRVLAPGGVAVLSGLLRAQEAQVLAPHRGLGLTLRRRIRLGSWSTLVLAG